MDPLTRGDPTSPLRWTCKSRAKLAAVLAQQGWRVSSTTVGRMLHQLGYRLQSVRKRQEGASRGGPHRLDHLAAFLRWTPQFLLPPVREILRGGEPEGKVPLRMFFQASVHLLRRRPSVRRVRSLAVV